MTDSDPQVVFRTHSAIEANVVIGLLETRGIDAVASSAAPHAIFPLTVNGLGEVRLTVRGEQARRARRLIAEFGRQTGVPVVVNTSMNVMGEPIVNTPAEAHRMLVQTDMDCLVAGDCIVRGGRG